MTETTHNGAPTRLDRAGLRGLGPYLRALRHHKADLILVHLLMFFATSVSLAIPIYAGRFVDALTRGELKQEASGAVVVVAVLLVIQLVTTYFSTVVSTRFGLAYVTTLRRQLMGHLLELPSLFFVRQKAGDLASRMTSDVGSIKYLMTSGVVSLSRAAITLIGAVILMLHLNTRLTLVILALVPSTILLVRLFGKRLRHLSREMLRELGQINSHVQTVSGAIREIKVYNNQPHELNRFADMLSRYYVAGLRRAKLSAALESGTQILLWICLIVVVVYGFYLTAQQQTSFGELVAFFLLAYRVAFPMSMLTSLYTSAQGAVAAAGRLDEVFLTPPEQSARPPQGAPPVNAGALRLENVSFAYDHEPVIRELSLTIQPGEWVGIVGPSGAGKTTLSGLILRLFDPDVGRLVLDDRAYTDYDLSVLRGQMAFVSQEPILFDISIHENIRFGLATADETAVREAARRANALKFIEALPDGFATEVGERGVRLSGGERQRITLARAFLRNPRILVLDEPTSALDAKSEEAVREALTTLMSGRTAIVIAHRLSLVRDLNRIFVLADGRLEEEGSHTELMAKQGLYHSLYRLQQGV